MTLTQPPSYQFLDDNLDTSLIALCLLTTPTSPQQTPQTTPQATPQTTPPTLLPTPSPLNTTLPPNTLPSNTPPPPPPLPTSQHPMVTHSKVRTVKTNPKYNFHVTTSSSIPKSPFHALRDPNLKQAMCDEYKALIDNETWVLVPCPPNVNIVRSMWFYKHKYNADGSLSRYKYRLDANGRSQQQGIDCDETFSHVVKPAIIRTVLSLAVSRQWPIHQLDVKNAFLHGHLTKTVYMHQPPRFTDSAYPDYVCILQKSLYGLKQTSRAWFHRFASYAIRACFHHSKTDSSLFIFHRGPNTAYLLLYVGDIILTAFSTGLLQRIISSLHNEFSMTDLGPLNYFLSILATRTPTGMFLSQSKYATEILEMTNMLKCKPCKTTVNTEKKLRPDGPQSLTQPFIVAGCPATHRSTSGYCVFLSDNLLSWSSKRQHTLSRFSAEAEYRGVTNVVAETTWIPNLLRELKASLFTATLVYCDNVCAVYMSANPMQHQRTKHIEIDIHFVRDKVATGHIRVLHAPSRYQ
ncbi:ribonuclease H-like domain-containing protein [Tanacetum coccineum]